METFLDYLSEEYEFCPCGDLPSDQCDGEMCEDLEDMLLGEEAFISDLPSDLTGIDLDTFDY
jgi:hypothetical protein